MDYFDKNLNTRQKNQKFIYRFGYFKTKVTLLLLFSLTVLIAQIGNAQMFWNQAGAFTGSANSYVVVPSSTELDITGSFTLECWVNPTIIQTSILIQKREGSNNVGYTLYLSSNEARIRTNTSTKLSGKTPLNNNTWTHVAGTYEQSTSTFSIYLNGILDTSAVFAGAEPVSNSDSLYIGTGSNGPFSGYLDNVRIWNRALSPTQIRNNMRTALGATGGIYNGLVLSFPFQNYYKSYLNLTDQSGNGNTGINRGITNLDYTYQPPTYHALNEAVDLDGTGDYLSGPHSTNLNVTSFTIECWINPKNVNSPTYQMLISKANPSYTSAYDLLMDDGRVRIRTNGTTRLIGNMSIPNNEWSHVASTFDAATYEFKTYVNGVFDSSVVKTSAAIPTTNTDSLFLGAGLNSDFAGYIDEVRISNYVKTQEDISSYLYRSIDQTNEPNSGNINIVYNLDGNTYANAMDGGPRLYFRGDANFTNPSVISNAPISPLTRADALSFSEGYYIKSSNKRIPESGTSGAMVTDSIYISPSITINDVNLFIGTNHTAEADLQIKLVSPDGDSVTVFYNTSLKNTDHVITIFDDQADSSLVSGRYTSFGPIIKPANSLNSVFSGMNTRGMWLLRIYDSYGGDTGRVYAWGIQFNNQTTVGVENIFTSIPNQFQLFQNYPNPFNPTTTITYTLPTAQQVSLKVYNLIGQEVMTLVNERQEAGVKFVKLDASGLPSGVYLYRLNAGTFEESKRMIILK